MQTVWKTGFPFFWKTGFPLFGSSCSLYRVRALVGLRQKGLSPTVAYALEDRVFPASVFEYGPYWFRNHFALFPFFGSSCYLFQIKALVGLRQVGLSPTVAYSPEDKVRTLRTFRNLGTARIVLEIGLPCFRLSTLLAISFRLWL